MEAKPSSRDQYDGKNIKAILTGQSSPATMARPHAQFLRVPIPVMTFSGSDT